MIKYMYKGNYYFLFVRGEQQRPGGVALLAREREGVDFKTCVYESSGIVSCREGGVLSACKEVTL